MVWDIFHSMMCIRRSYIQYSRDVVCQPSTARVAFARRIFLLGNKNSFGYHTSDELKPHKDVCSATKDMAWKLDQTVAKKIRKMEDGMFKTRLLKDRQRSTPYPALSSEIFPSFNHRATAGLRISRRDVLGTEGLY